jgi:hypothetical protein
LGQTEQNWDNPCVSNILRVRKMTLKFFPVHKNSNY